MARSRETCPQGGDETLTRTLGERRRRRVLVTLVEAYERKHFPMDATDPVSAIRLAMERTGLTPRDLVPMIGCLDRVHEILTGHRGLTLAMTRRLHDGLGIPAETLIRPSKRRTAA